jgi:hypothetical protein
METPRNVVQDVPNLLYQDTRARAELNKVLDLTGLRKSVGLPGLEPGTSSLSVLIAVSYPVLLSTSMWLR